MMIQQPAQGYSVSPRKTNLGWNAKLPENKSMTKYVTNYSEMTKNITAFLQFDLLMILHSMNIFVKELEL